MPSTLIVHPTGLDRTEAKKVTRHQPDLVHIALGDAVMGQRFDLILVRRLYPGDARDTGWNYAKAKDYLDSCVRTCLKSGGLWLED